MVDIELPATPSVSELATPHDDGALRDALSRLAASVDIVGHLYHRYLTAVKFMKKRREEAAEELEAGGSDEEVVDTDMTNGGDDGDDRSDINNADE